jgi:hypothetical protein
MARTRKTVPVDPENNTDSANSTSAEATVSKDAAQDTTPAVAVKTPDTPLEKDDAKESERDTPIATVVDKDAAEDKASGVAGEELPEQDGSKDKTPTIAIESIIYKDRGADVVLPPITGDPNKDTVKNDSFVRSPTGQSRPGGRRPSPIKSQHEVIASSRSPSPCSSPRKRPKHDDTP